MVSVSLRRRITEGEGFTGTERMSEQEKVMHMENIHQFNPIREPRFDLSKIKLNLILLLLDFDLTCSDEAAWPFSDFWQARLLLQLPRAYCFTSHYQQRVSVQADIREASPGAAHSDQGLLRGCAVRRISG